MLHQDQIPALLLKELPEIIIELKKIFPSKNIFKVIRCLSDFTMNRILAADFITARKCFAIAEEVYLAGNTLVKISIENVFVFSFSSMINTGNIERMKQLQYLIPVCLQTIYMQQIYKSGV